MKMEQQNTSGKEGVEVLQQVPFEDEKLGEGQFTSKVYHLQRFVCMQSSTFCFASVGFTRNWEGGECFFTKTKG
jgi:hypothetical protein